MPEPITSLQNQRIKNAIKLRNRKGRDYQKRIIIDGNRELQRALDAGINILEVYYCPKLCIGVNSHHILASLEHHDTEVLTVSESVFDKLSFGERAEGFVAVAETPRQSLHDLQLTNHALIAVLESVEKPGNIGAVARSADASGVEALIVADEATDLYNPNSIRSSSGTIFTLPVCATGSKNVITWLRKKQFKICAARVDGAKQYDKTDYTGPTAIVLGSEQNGLSQIWHASDVVAVKLPMLGVADSLNVSTTAAVLFYEALRQRTT